MFPDRQACAVVKALVHCQLSRSVDGDRSCQCGHCFYGGEDFWRSVLAITVIIAVSTTNPELLCQLIIRSSQPWNGCVMCCCETTREDEPCS